MYEAFSLAHLPSSASAKVIKRHRQKMVTDSRDRERKNASLSAGRSSCLTRPSAKRYHSRLITLPLTASQINCPFPQTWRSWWGWGCCGRPDSLPPPLYWVPGGLLAACFLTGILVGKSDSRTMNSVEWWISLFPKGFLSFLLNLKDGRAGGKNPPRNEGDVQEERDAGEELGCIKDTEITKLRFSPQDYFCFSPSSIIFVTPSSSFHPVVLFMLPSFSYMISSSLTWLLFSFPLLSIIFFFHPVSFTDPRFLPSKFLFHLQFNFPPFLLSPKVTHLSLSFSYSSLLLIMFVLFLTCCLHLCHLTFSLFKVATNYVRSGEN